MTATDLSAYVGREVLIHCDRPRVAVRCRILDARERFGRLDLLIHPLDGEGQDWIASDRIVHATACRTA